MHYPQSSLVQVNAYGANEVQYFCIRTDYCKFEAEREKIRLEAFHNLHKQGKAMIESSSKRHKPLQPGDNVRIPIPIVDRAPIGPLSLLATVTGVSPSGSVFQVGTKHGRIETPFTYSDISPCGTNKLLQPADIPDRQLSVRTAARHEGGSFTRVSCKCKSNCTTNRCVCRRNSIKCSSKCHNSLTTCANKH